jgi:hypothetical protein
LEHLSLWREIKREDIREYKFYDIYFNHKDKKSSPCPLQRGKCFGSDIIE